MQTLDKEKVGFLEVASGIRTPDQALAIRAGLEDLPGVHLVDFVGRAVRIRFDPQLVDGQKVYEAARIAGFHPQQFHIAD